MKKIAIVGNYGLGLIKFRKELIQTLVNEGHDVYIIYPKDEYLTMIENMGVTVLDLAMSRHGTGIVSEIKTIRSLYQYIKDYQFDTILTFTIKPNVYTGFISQFQQINFIPNVTGLGSLYHASKWGQKTYVFLHKLAFRKANHIFFQNETNKKIFEENRILSKYSNYSVLPGSGVNVSKFNFLEYPINEKFNFLFIGRLTKDKGVYELLEAFTNIYQKQNQIELRIVGIVDDVEIEDKIKSIASIRYEGLQEDVRPYIQASNCVVLPSYHEGMSNVLLESAASGRPLLATNIPGCKEIVKQGENGYLVEPRSTNSLELGMKRMLELSQEELKVMGQKSRNIAETNFNRNIVVKEYLEKGILNEKLNN